MKNIKRGVFNFLMVTVLGMGLAFAGGLANSETVYANEGDQKVSVGGINDFGLEFDEDGNLLISSADFAESGNKASAWGNLIEKYRFVVVGISGIGTVSMILFFIWNCILLGKASSDSGARSKAVTGLVWSGAAAMLLGSATFIVGMFYGALK